MSVREWLGPRSVVKTRTLGTGAVLLGTLPRLLLVHNSLLQLPELPLGRKRRLGGRHHLGPHLSQLLVQAIHGLHLLHDLFLLAGGMRGGFLVGLRRQRKDRKHVRFQPS